MLVLADGFRKVVEEHLHRLGVHVGQNEREGVVGAGFDARQDVGEREAVVAQSRRALPAFPPDTADAAFLADAGLVLQKQPEPLAIMCSCNSGQQASASF